jgi:hypothetical protein
VVSPHVLTPGQSPLRKDKVVDGARRHLQQARELVKGGAAPAVLARPRVPCWGSPMANVIHAPAIDRQHLGRDEAGIRLDQESHGGGNVLRRANPTDHGALAH